MRHSEYNIGQFLYKLPSPYTDYDVYEKYHPKNQRVFIHNGYVNGDGYGQLIGFEDGKLVKSTGWNNFMWGGDVRLATYDEIEDFMEQLMLRENQIKDRR